MEARRFDGQLKALPSKPGVYLFKDISGNVLYVGKAGTGHWGRIYVALWIQFGRTALAYLLYV